MAFNNHKHLSAKGSLSPLVIIQNVFYEPRYIAMLSLLVYINNCTILPILAVNRKGLQNALGGAILLVISLLWSTIVGFMGLEEERPWGSFFLQYLWEFGLGMWIAEHCLKADGNNVKYMDVSKHKWRCLLLGAIGGISLSAFMAWNGGILKLYNDFPSLVGYMSFALLIYKFGVKVVNRFFEWANSFSYELYLVHSLVFTIVTYFGAEKTPAVLLLLVSFIAAYLFAYLYKMVTKKITLI